MAIPGWLVGAWERKYIQREEHGGEKTEQGVAVRYLQGGKLFADVRVGEGEEAKCSMSFGGAGRLVGDVLEWHAVHEDGTEIDEEAKWKQISENTSVTEDKGRVVQISPDAWMEYGSNYVEEWHRLPTTHTGTFAAHAPGCLYIAAPPYFTLIDSSTSPPTYVTGKGETITHSLHPAPGRSSGDPLKLPEGKKWTPCPTSDPTLAPPDIEI